MSLTSRLLVNCELDDIEPYITAGRKIRLSHHELFDVSNVAVDGSIIDPDSATGHANRVISLVYLSVDADCC